MRVGAIEIKIFKDSNNVWITKHYNELVNASLDLNEDDIYHLEFAIKEIKRQLDLK